MPIHTLSPRAIHHRITMQYSLAVGLIAVLVVGSGLLLGTLSTQHALDSEIVAAASTQRTLALQAAVGAGELASAEISRREQPTTSMLEASAALEKQHAMLRAVAISSATGNDDLRLIYSYLDSGVERFTSQTREFARDVDTLADPKIIAEDIEAQASGGFMSRLSRAVRLHILAGNAAAQNIIDLNVAVTLAILALLALTVLIIFRPLARDLSDFARRLSAEASTDPLTGLLNRRAFRSELENQARCKSVGLMMIDLDWFKLVNDSDGHAAGDRLLCELTARLNKFADAHMLIGRWGGDEFIVAIIGRDKATTLAHAVSIHKGLMPVNQRSTEELPISATAGVAWADSDRANIEAVLAAADDAARRGKEISRGTLYPALPEDFARLDREILILHALEQTKGCPTEACAFLQPIVRLTDGEVVGMEMLARWNHPEIGMIDPTEFIDIATRSGWMLALGSHIRQSGFAAIASLLARGHRVGRIAINLGQPELARDSILQGIEAELAACGLPLTILEIEITEDLLLDRVPEVVRERLTALRARGARLALDDFGTGYAGMSQLLRLPLDAIKLDRSFAGADGIAAEVVRATIGLAQGLGLELVVEGIETPEQLSRLTKMGAHQGQGYLFTKALSLDDMAAWLDTRASAKVLQLRVA